MLQSVPEIKGFLDYGATAALAAYMVWLWNKHTLRWQDKQEKVDEIHRSAMTRMADAQATVLTKLVDRYDHHLEKLLLVLECNTKAGVRMADALAALEDRRKE